MRKSSRVNLKPKVQPQLEQWSDVEDESGEQEPNDNHNNSKKQQEQQFSLYLFLQVPRDATPDQIKKQYRRLVLKYHPDKNLGDPSAKEKFQKLKQASDILSDPQKRKVYDQTGTLGDDEFDQKGFQSAYDYFRSIYKKVTQEDIDDFSKRYRYGEMEEEDLMDFYQQHEGNMVQLIESIPLSTNQDIGRFMEFYEQKIKEGQLQRYKNFDKTKKKIRLLKDETEEVEEIKKEKKNSELNQLAVAIKKNGNKHQDFLAALEEKYGGGKKKKAESKVPKDKKKITKAKKQ